ncbi:hypothetical protein PUN28_005481 [Cardiocondyla obscurior]|uniref:Uncharacterized protein n=1 Tax=Cardiocondyla obscurior TaxID=286306 RepID=A0AAW2GI02_9HYME
MNIVIREIIPDKAAGEARCARAALGNHARREFRSTTERHPSRAAAAAIPRSRRLSPRKNAEEKKPRRWRRGRGGKKKKRKRVSVQFASRTRYRTGPDFFFSFLFFLCFFLFFREKRSGARRVDSGEELRHARSPRDSSGTIFRSAVQRASSRLAGARRMRLELESERLGGNVSYRRRTWPGRASAREHLAAIREASV